MVRQASLGLSRACGGAVLCCVYSNASAAEQVGLLGPSLWVIGLLALLGGAGWLAYRRQKILSPFSQEHFQILAQQSLGPREKLWLVELSGRRYVLGQTAHQITFIDSFETDAANSVSTEHS